MAFCEKRLHAAAMTAVAVSSTTLAKKADAAPPAAGGKSQSSCCRAVVTADIQYVALPQTQGPAHNQITTNMTRQEKRRSR